MTDHTLFHEHEPAPSRAHAAQTPYAPSWVDRFTDWIERLPGPSWAWYAAAAAVLAVLVTVSQWEGPGTLPRGGRCRGCARFTWFLPRWFLTSWG
jgi:hypothetical protein